MTKVLYLLSDSLGETVMRVARAATTQFGQWGNLEYRPYNNLRDTRRIDAILAEAQGTSCCFMYTIVEQELRNYLSQRLAERNLPAFDIMGPALKLLSQLLESDPTYRPGLTHQLDASYFERIEAIEFAVRYDDGKNPKGFLEADIVLLGVSRTSKTPLSMYLANKGYKVANLPLIANAPIPEELQRIPRRRIIGLTIDASHLLQVRQERLVDLRLPRDAAYAQMSYIEQELSQAQALFQRLRCKVIDVSNKAIEETASRVIAHIVRSADDRD